MGRGLGSPLEGQGERELDGSRAFTDSANTDGPSAMSQPSRLRAGGRGDKALTCGLR